MDTTPDFQSYINQPHPHRHQQVTGDRSRFQGVDIVTTETWCWQILDSIYGLGTYLRCVVEHGTTLVVA